jgi:hypothetical protein
VTGEPIELTSAVDFDPIGGDGELPEETDFAIDGNQSGTQWVGEHYDTELFGGLKDGVGLYVETEDAVTPTTMIVRSPVGGWDAEIYSAASGPPETLDGWTGPIGTITNADTESQAPLEVPEPSRFFLLWFTKLASASDEDRFRPEVSDIELVS